MRPTLAAVGLVVLSTAHGRVILNRHSILARNQTPELERMPRSLIMRRDDDPADFGWIKNWAAVGDSFTAGIGAGTPLGDRWHNNGDWECSRYLASYPLVLNDAFGEGVEDFQFVACSGDRTEGIYEQVNNMNGDLDLVVMTAGGNDLCLADLIKSCIFMPDEGDCESVIEKAQENIDNILKDNIREVLDALNDKMNDDSVVIYNGYAQFFNTENEDCNDQEWRLVPGLGSGADMSIARRKQFNELVRNINSAIKEVVEEYADSDDVKYNIGFSNWDVWVYEGVDGNMCDPSSTGRYPDPDQPDLHFFKPDTRPSEDLLLRRAEVDRKEQLLRNRLPREAIMGRFSAKSLYDSVLYKSPSPAAIALKKLDRRAPTPPGCPSDSGWLPEFPIPDSVGKNFHPNELGHITIASFASAEIMDIRAKILGVEAPSCEVQDEFKCWQDAGWKAYANADLLDENIDKFCDNDMRVKRNGDSWLGSVTYYKGTPEEVDFAVELRSNDKSTSELREECKDSMSRIIHGCDGNDPDNPLNWKFGGQYRRGDITWEVSPVFSKRPWPPLKEKIGECEGWWKVLFSSYEIQGGGWSTHDWGQKTLLPKTEDCTGSDPTKWKFEYFDEADEDGHEWKATFRAPIWVRARCFNNNKVAFWSGGFTDGCKGND